MKENELRKHLKCHKCGKLLGESFRENGTLPFFWTLKVQRYVIDSGAVSRQQGLTMMLGGHAALAQVIGPNEEMATPVFEKPAEITLCEHCAVSNRVVIIGLVEKINRRIK